MGPIGYSSFGISLIVGRRLGRCRAAVEALRGESAAANQAMTSPFFEKRVTVVRRPRSCGCRCEKAAISEFRPAPNFSLILTM